MRSVPSARPRPARPPGSGPPRRGRGALTGAALGAVLAAGALAAPGAQARVTCASDTAPCPPSSKTRTSATGTVSVARGYSLTVRARPRSSAKKVRSVRNGATVRIVCQRTGQSVKGRFGRSRIWDRLQGGGFVSDAYVYTGSDGRVAPACREGKGSGGDPAPQPPVDAGNRPSWVPKPYWPLIKRAGAKQDIDPALLAAQLQTESSWRPTVCSSAGACGLAQFLPSTWAQPWNPYREHAKGYLVPRYAIPAQALYMKRLLREARGKDVGLIRRTMDRRDDISDAQLNAIDFGDPYQVALMGYIAGFGDYSIWGPNTAEYPVKITRQAEQR